MAKLTKNQKKVLEKYDPSLEYSLEEASKLIKDINYAKFDASVDIDVKLGVDPRKADQMVRGVVTLPHGTGKEVKVLVLCTPDKEEEAKAAGADYVGLDDYVKKIKVENPSTVFYLNIKDGLFVQDRRFYSPGEEAVFIKMMKYVGLDYQNDIFYHEGNPNYVIREIACTSKGDLEIAVFVEDNDRTPDPRLPRGNW